MSDKYPSAHIIQELDAERDRLKAVVDSWKEITDMRESLLAEISRLKAEVELMQTVAKGFETKAEKLSQALKNIGISLKLSWFTKENARELAKTALEDVGG